MSNLDNIEAIFLIGNIILSVYMIYISIKNYRKHRHWTDIFALFVGICYAASYIYILSFSSLEEATYRRTFTRITNVFAQTLIIVLLIFKKGNGLQ